MKTEHTYTDPFYSPLDFVQDYPGELVPEPIWILLKQETVSGKHGKYSCDTMEKITVDILPITKILRKCGLSNQISFKILTTSSYKAISMAYRLKIRQNHQKTVAI